LKVLRQLLLRGIAVPTTCLLRQSEWGCDRYRYYDVKTSNIITCHSLEVPLGRGPSTGSESRPYNWPRQRLQYHLPNDLKHCRDVIELLCHTIPVADLNAQPALPDPQLALLYDPTWDEVYHHYGPTSSTNIEISRKYLASRRTSCPLLYQELVQSEPRYDHIKMLLEMKASPNTVTYMGQNSLVYVMEYTSGAQQLQLLKLVCHSTVCVSLPQLSCAKLLASMVVCGNIVSRGRC
jgi:hypothetical protein